MTGTFPAVNDSKFDLWRRIANNWYAATQNAGIAGVNPPAVNDSEYDLCKRTAYYTALLADYFHP